MIQNNVCDFTCYYWWRQRVCKQLPWIGDQIRLLLAHKLLPVHNEHDSQISHQCEKLMFN